jgi:1-deoxy-D-xylulose-5-phosphate reductoisomerase
MVVCRDHSVLAQLGTPDMRVPIAYGLAFPERIESGAATLDFATLGALSFEPADLQRFPGLALAWEVLRGADGSSAVLNAANEVAVASFLQGAVPFPEIAASIDAVLEAAARQGVQPPETLAAIRELDTWARTYTWTRLRTASAS